MTVLRSLVALLAAPTLSSSVGTGSLSAVFGSVGNRTTGSREPFVALAFAAFDGGYVWAGNGAGIWRTNDQGVRWSEITPSNLVGDETRLSGSPVLAGSGARTFGSRRPRRGTSQIRANGALPSSAPSTAAVRGVGRRCRPVRPVPCPFPSWTPRHGFAFGSNGTLYSTSNGGAGWSTVSARLPVSEEPAVDFINTHVGWMTSGHLLERTTDAGRTWRRVVLGGAGSALAALSAPRFFSVAEGVVVATLPRGRGALYATDDGGHRWRAEPLPAAPNAPSPSFGWTTEPAFDVSSQAVWALASGRRLYVTGDSGRHWAAVPAPPTYGMGDPIWGFVMTGTRSGWLGAAAMPCRKGPQDLCSVPVLLRTNDQGKSWSKVPSSPDGSPVTIK